MKSQPEERGILPHAGSSADAFGMRIAKKRCSGSSLCATMPAVEPGRGVAVGWRYCSLGRGS